MQDFKKLYETDRRFREYIEKCRSDYDLTVEEMLRNKTIQLVGEYYIKNPPEREASVSTMKSGGC